jgi:hypothetical protein
VVFLIKRNGGLKMIIKVTGGDFKAKRILLQNSFTLLDQNKSSYTYDAEACIAKIEKLDEKETWLGKKISFKLVFKDGRSANAEIDQGDYKKLLDFCEKHKDSDVNGDPIVLSRGMRFFETIFKFLFLSMICVFAYHIIDYSLVGAGSVNYAEKKKPSEFRIDVNRLNAYDFCQDVVKKTLKAPTLAQFPKKVDVYFNDIDLYTIRSYVDAQNTFGAVLRKHYKCQLRDLNPMTRSGREWKVTQFDIEN